jgi:hypothetical protein
VLDEGNPEPLSCGPPKGLDTPEPFGRAVPTGEILAHVRLSFISLRSTRRRWRSEPPCVVGMGVRRPSRDVRYLAGWIRSASVSR